MHRLRRGAQTYCASIDSQLQLRIRSYGQQRFDAKFRDKPGRLLHGAVREARMSVSTVPSARRIPRFTGDLC